MSLTSALNAAISGLNANSRAVSVVSSNLANALTQGYAPRSLALEADGAGPGVRPAGVVRNVDTQLVQERRLATSALGQAETGAAFLSRIEGLIGTPDQAGSLSARLTAFESDLVSAANRPEAGQSLQAAVNSAKALTGEFVAISSGLQAMRSEAESAISRAVGTINSTLSEIETLNAGIASARAQGRETAGLEDTRQKAIDRMAEFLPLRQAPRDNGMVALFTKGGATLVDGPAAQLEFTPANVIAPHMTAENGLLNGLTINGVPVPVSADDGPVGGGRLATLFTIRDETAVNAQADLDALARNLVERFQQAGLDPSRGVGAPGLFTDSGSVFDPADETGLSGRLALNTAVDPASGGAPWRLRDGLGATAPGAAGDGSLLRQLSDVLVAEDTLASGALGAAARSASGHVAGFASQVSQARVAQDQSVSFAASRHSELAAQEARGGVDSDLELQRLLSIEQAYSANARMIETVDEMMQTLLRV